MEWETVKALEKSICKHSLIAYGMKADFGGEDCALCQLFKECWVCPVYCYTEQEQCAGTPWRWKYDLLTYFNHYSFPELLKKLPDCYPAEGKFWYSIDLEEQEVIFLCSLLPKDHKWYEEYENV